MQCGATTIYDYLHAPGGKIIFFTAGACFWGAAAVGVTCGLEKGVHHRISRLQHRVSIRFGQFLLR
jgi:hypothetical protein